ncbi:Fis family transcriptional regulator, partial [Gammaproteobacteria bacterium]|nr:Fis family transcriptional regulator [Gammaproteobacteria bacterium]
PLKEEVRKAMKRYFKQLDQNNIPIDVYQLVLNEIEPPLLSSVMKFSNNNQSKASKVLGINRTTLRTKLKKYDIK